MVFPGWYPNRMDKLSGDFIQRHIHAVSLHCRVSVIVAAKDNSITRQDIVTVKNGNLTEQFYYYPSLSSIKWLDNLLSFIRYNYICFTAARQLFKAEKPTIVHLYVLQKNHLLGLLLQFLYKVPYVISEQSTLYIDGRFDKMNQLQKSVYSFVFKRSASFHVVSKFLHSNLKSKLHLVKEGIIIPNVVNTSLFYFNRKMDNSVITFVHVSNMSPQKNVEGMLQAFAEVKKVNTNFYVHLVGPLPQSISSLIIELGLSKHIQTWNERSYKEVAEIMQQSDVFVFFTRYETFGCVIIEANACGLPLLISDLEVTRELITDQFNGVFAESGNVKDLTLKILFMMNNLKKFNPPAISLQASNRFNYERIGRQFFDWYTFILKQ